MGRDGAGSADDVLACRASDCVLVVYRNTRPGKVDPRPHVKGKIREYLPL